MVMPPFLCVREDGSISTSFTNPQHFIFKCSSVLAKISFSAVFQHIPSTKVTSTLFIEIYEKKKLFFRVYGGAGLRVCHTEDVASAGCS